MNIARNKSYRKLIARLVAILLRTEVAQRFRRRARSILRKLMLAGYIYVGLVVARVVAKLVFGWEIWPGN